MFKRLKEFGLEHTFNWAENIKENETKEDLIEFSRLEKQAIKDSDIVIILLPAGRGTHTELGMALAFDKKVYLCANDENDLNDSVNFYHLPEIIKISGSVDDIIKEIIKLEGIKYGN